MVTLRKDCAIPRVGGSIGIAKLAENRGPGQVETRTGTILGSPAYMSPEQCRNVGKVDDRSDVYALGVILYEMLSGRQPFRSESEAEIMAMHMYATPPPLRQLVPDVDPALDALALSMLNKNAAERPAMHDVLTTLNQIGGFSSTGLRPVLRPVMLLEPSAVASTLSRASGAGTVQPQRRWRLRAALIGGGVLLAAVVTSFLIAQELRHPGPRPAGASAPGTREPDAPAQSLISWSIRSEPTGAQVWSLTQSRLLGQTPYATLVPREAGVERLVLKLSGYKETPVTLDRSTSSERTVALLPGGATEAPVTPGQNPPPSVGKSGKLKSKPKGPRIKNADIELIK